MSPRGKITTNICWTFNFSSTFDHRKIQPEKNEKNKQKNIYRLSQGPTKTKWVSEFPIFEKVGYFFAVLEARIIFSKWAPSNHWNLQAEIDVALNLKP